MTTATSGTCFRKLLADVCGKTHGIVYTFCGMYHIYRNSTIHHTILLRKKKQSFTTKFKQSSLYIHEVISMITCVCNILQYSLHRQVQCRYTVQGQYVEILHIGSTLTMDNNNNTVNGLHHPNLKLVSEDIFI